MFDFEEALRLVSKQTVLCVGDVMLDDFVYGEVSAFRPRRRRRCWRVKHNTIEVGGAGNRGAQYRGAWRDLHVCRPGR